MKFATLLSAPSRRLTYEMWHNACMHSELSRLTGGDAIHITALMRKTTALEIRDSLVQKSC
jgi:hypothetical protein